MMKHMDIPVYYVSLPHDLAGSRSKNRFRVELLWGVSKMLDLMEQDRDFAMVFDYVCDIEVHYRDGLDFYQIKSHGGAKPYTSRRLTKIDGQGSILGKLYILKKDNPSTEIRVAVVSNIPYSALSEKKTISCFSDLSSKEKQIIIDALKSELNITSVDLSSVFYIQTNMDLEHPDDAVRGKLTLAFERIKKCEPANPNALYRLVVDTVSEKACYEYAADDYEEILRLKGLTRSQFDDLLELHAEKSQTGILAATKYIEKMPKVRDRRIYKQALPKALKLLSTSKPIKAIEQDIVRYLYDHDVGETEHAIDILIANFHEAFSVEVSNAEKVIIYIIIIMRYENGAYEHENVI